jgi:plasmid stabilization system protein ParE
MTFQVIFRPRARSGIAAAVLWLASTSAAARWRNGWLKIISNLESDPTRYPPAEAAPDLDIDLRQLEYGRRRNVYRVLFTIDGQTVNILRVRHAAQDHLSADDL